MEQRGALATISPDEIQSKMYSDQWKKTLLLDDLLAQGQETASQVKKNRSSLQMGLVYSHQVHFG